MNITVIDRSHVRDTVRRICEECLADFLDNGIDADAEEAIGYTQAALLAALNDRVEVEGIRTGS